MRKIKNQNKEEGQHNPKQVQTIPKNIYTYRPKHNNSKVCGVVKKKGLAVLENYSVSCSKVAVDWTKDWSNHRKWPASHQTLPKPEQQQGHVGQPLLQRQPDLKRVGADMPGAQRM